MRVEYVVTRQAILSASRLQTRPVRLFLVLSVTYLVAMLGVALLDGWAPCQLACAAPMIPSMLGGGLAFGLAMTGLFWFVLLPYRAWKLHRQNPMLFGASVLTTGDEGIEMQTPRTSGTFRWNDLKGYRENAQVFVLSLSRTAGLVVSKAGIAEGDVATLQALLAQRLKRL